MTDDICDDLDELPVPPRKLVLKADRQLLKLAARAAGIAGFQVKAGLNIGSNATPDIWNPLTDDGDALRLAVNMAFNVYHIDPYVFVEDPQYSHTICISEYYADHKDGKFAATRRAVVRAAAEIGKQHSRSKFVDSR